MQDDPNYVSPWTYGWSKRGYAIEKMLGGNGDNSPTIDRIAGPVAISIKSIDLNARSYQDTSTLRSQIKRYINKARDYTVGRFNGEVVTKGRQFRTTALDLAIPENATAGQLSVIAQMYNYGFSQGVYVNVVVIK